MLSLSDSSIDVEDPRDIIVRHDDRLPETPAVLETLESLLAPARIRQELDLRQEGLAGLLGVSVRAVQSWEQGWRKPSAAISRYLLLVLLAARLGDGLGSSLCWEATRCSEAERALCLVYRSRQGHLCWFFTGNVCRGKRYSRWQDKMSRCQECEFLLAQLSAAGLTGETSAEVARDLPRLS